MSDRLGDFPLRIPKLDIYLFFSNSKACAWRNNTFNNLTVKKMKRKNTRLPIAPDGLLLPACKNYP